MGLSDDAQTNAPEICRCGMCGSAAPQLGNKIPDAISGIIKPEVHPRIL
jgi:hypothetical protein